MTSRRLALILSTAAVAAAPVMTAASAAPSQPAAHERVFGYADSGRTVNVSNGATFQVRLENCADCGQQWHFVRRPAARTVTVVSRHEVSTAKPPAVGGDAHTIWTFHATRNPGKTSMEMVETSAERGGKVIKRFTLTVDVHTLAMAG